MLTVLAFLSALVMMSAVLWYCPLIIRRKVAPPPATWIIASVAMTISALAYYATGRSWIDGVTVYASTVEILIVTTVLHISLFRHKEFSISFDWIQKLSLAIMAGILVYWYFNRNASVTFVTTQSLMLVAYIPTVAKLLKLKKAFDSIGNWGIIFLASIIGGVIPFVNGNHLAEFSAARAVIASGLTFFLFIYYDRANGWVRLKSETVGRF